MNLEGRGGREKRQNKSVPFLFRSMEQTDEVIAPELLSYPKPCFVNLGTGEDVTIRELAETVQRVVGFEGKPVFDASKPDGTPRKLQNVSRMNGMGWKHKVGLEEGIARAYGWYRENYLKDVQ